MKTASVFAQRLFDLRESKNIKRQEMAESLGISRASLEYYEKGKRKPDIEMVIKIASYLSVSTDYLLGITDAKTNNKDIQFICDYTGLTANSVNVLSSIKDNPKQVKVLNFLLEYINPDSVCDTESQYINTGNDFLNRVENFYNIKESDDLVVFADNQIVHYREDIEYIAKSLKAIADNKQPPNLKDFGLEDMKNKTIRILNSSELLNNLAYNSLCDFLAESKEAYLNKEVNSNGNNTQTK